GYQAASFPAVGDGGLREGCVRPVRRALVKEPALGAHLSAVEEIPRRGVPVVPRLRVDLRQLRAQLEDRRRERLSAAVREFCREQTPLRRGLFLVNAYRDCWNCFSRSSSDFAGPELPLSSSGTTIWTLLGSTVDALSRKAVTRPGQKMTMPTMMSCSTTHGIAPQ